MQSPVRDSSRGNTPIPAVGPEFTPSPTSQPDQDSGLPDDSKVRITQCCMLNFHIKNLMNAFVNPLLLLLGADMGATRVPDCYEVT